MCEKCRIFNSNSVPTYRTRTITKKAYRTSVQYPYHYKKSVPYFLAKIEAYRTVPTYRTVLPSLLRSAENVVFFLFCILVGRAMEGDILLQICIFRCDTGLMNYSELYMNTTVFFLHLFLCIFLFCLIHIPYPIDVHEYCEAAMQTCCMS